jgi:streptogramin lyase
MTMQSLDHRAVLLVVAVSLAAAATVTAQQDRGTWVITDQAGQVTEREPLEFTTVDVGLPRPIEVKTVVLAADPGIPVDLLMTTDTYVTHREAAHTVGSIREFAQDADGRLWLWDTDGSLAYQAGADLVYVNGIKAALVVAHPDGSMWVMGRSKASRVAVDGITVYEVPNRTVEFSGISVAPDGDVWVVGVNEETFTSIFALRFDGSTWREYGAVPGLPSPSGAVRVVVDHDGMVWVALSRGTHPELLSFDGQTWTGHHMNVRANDSMRLYLDHSGRMWATTPLLAYIRDNSAWQVYEAPHWAETRGLATDGLGRTWIFGGNEIGVLDGTRWTFIDLSAYITALGGFGPLTVEPVTGDVLISINGSDPALLRWVDSDRASVVEDEDSALPTSSQLQGNYPNPFNSTTQITFQLARSEAASLQIFDLAGQLVATLWQGSTIGRYQVPWDGTANGNPVASGVYFYALFTPGQTHYGKMVLVR